MGIIMNPHRDVLKMKQNNDSIWFTGCKQNAFFLVVSTFTAKSWQIINSKTMKPNENSEKQLRILDSPNSFSS